MKTLKDLGDLKGKRVLVRADFNVPLDGTTITDDGRIKAALPTIKALREQGAKVILMAHLGRPKGKVVPELSLAPVAARLGELLGITVPLAADTYGEDAQAKVAAMNDGDVVLLQNVRFNPEETSKDPESVPHTPRRSPLSVRSSSPTASVSCTAPRAPTMMSPPICRPPLACWSRRKSGHCPAPP